MLMPIVKCENATLGYDGVPCIAGLNFAVNSGDYILVVGENGAGKSTLIKGLLGLVAPISGTISFDGALKQNEIGYLPQQTQAQRDFPASVREVVLSGRLGTLGMIPFYRKSDRAAAADYMDKLGITDLKDACYRELSGGQQQRVRLARALCATRSLLILDEPVSGLDPVATQELYKLIAAINRDMGITIIMVTHDIKSAAEFSNMILHLKNKQLFFGPTADYLTTESGRAFAGGAVR